MEITSAVCRHSASEEEVISVQVLAQISRDWFTTSTDIHWQHMTLQVLFFDIDGTMLSTGGAGQRAMELALTEEFCIDFPFEGVLTAGRTDCGIADEIFQRYQLPDSPQQRDRFMRSYLERLPHCLNELPGSLLPGIRELLDQLVTQEQCVLSLLTGNYAEGAWIKLRHFQLDHFFEFGGFGDHHPHRDDVARVALASAASHLKRPVDGSQTCVIGDTPADIQCARAINARAVAVATGMYAAEQLRPHAPDHLFEDLSRTSEIVRVLAAPAEHPSFSVSTTDTPRAAH